MIISRRNFLRGLIAAPALWVPGPDVGTLFEQSPPLESLFPINKGLPPSQAAFAESELEYVNSNQWPLMSVSMNINEPMEMYARIATGAGIFLGVIVPYSKGPAIIENIVVPSAPFTLFLKPVETGFLLPPENEAEIWFKSYGPIDVVDEFSDSSVMCVGMVNGPKVKAKTWRLL
jgi:hypothetical protein